jgi:hypothetical protein
MREFAHGDNGVAKNGHVRPGTFTFDHVGRVGIANLEKRHGHRGQMPASGGADDADALWVEVPFASTRADEADGAGDVLQFDGIMVAVETEAVFEDETRDTLAGEPFGIALAFMRRKVGVTATGANDHGRAVGGAVRREKWREGRNVLRGGAESAGCFAGPKGKSCVRIAHTRSGEIGCFLCRKSSCRARNEEEPRKGVHRRKSKLEMAFPSTEICSENRMHAFNSELGNGDVSICLKWREMRFCDRSNHVEK